MKNILLFLFFTLALTSTSHANGVVIVDATQGIYFNLKKTDVNVEVSNQVAIVTSNQIFTNNTGKAQKVKYAFPMPKSGTAIQLKWKKDSTWNYAEFSIGDQDTTLTGGGGGGTIDPKLTSYLGETPLYFVLKDSIPNNAETEIEIKYVQLLDYKNNKVLFSYPSDYSLIQTSIIGISQNIHFQLKSNRTIKSVEMEQYSPTIMNDGNTAEFSYKVHESASISNYSISYELASDELGIIDFSSYLPDSIQTYDSLGNGFLSVILEPESNESVEVIEKVFTLIIDKSGSMAEKNRIFQAKNAATFIVNHLNPGDYFNIITFDQVARNFKPTHVEFNLENQNEALLFISNINAVGGTNISDALTSAINQFGYTNENKANIIIFFTDGEATHGITSTTGILNAVKNAVNQKETNIFLFTFGIGPINPQLLTLLASENNGISKFVTDDEVESVISDFYLAISNPVLINTQIEFEPNVISEIYPIAYPNLYKGMQLSITGRYKNPQPIQMTLKGRAFNKDITFKYPINLSDSLNSNLLFMPKLWAKQKIEYLTNLFYSLDKNSEEANSIKSTIEEISVSYKVLSAFTSFTDNSATEIEEIFDSKKEFENCFYPNPFHDFTTLKIFLDFPQLIFIRIFDLKGNLILTFTHNGTSGENSIVWDGTDRDHVKIQNGIYFYIIKTEHNSFFGKILKN